MSATILANGLPLGAAAVGEHPHRLSQVADAVDASGSNDRGQGRL